jgi:hypothetical protein
LTRLEKLIFGGRWRRDEYAWRVWQELAPLIPNRLPEGWERMSMAGEVVRVYQRARRGTKALVYFGSAVGTRDTWWPHAHPPRKSWVVITAHIWLPPGTHSGREVLWVDGWEVRASVDVQRRALRHERRLVMEMQRREREEEKIQGASKVGD